MTTRNIVIRAVIYLAVLLAGIYFVAVDKSNPTGWIIIIGGVILFGLLAVRVLADRARKGS
jgi:protein-S-isoprenylcysteine O-methyltransferase Ste14